MTDRPAAELLAEIVPMFNEDRRRGRQLSVWADSYVYALRRLKRAEQALARVEYLLSSTEPSPFIEIDAIRVALRASQGGHRGDVVEDVEPREQVEDDIDDGPYHYVPPGDERG